MIPLPPKSVFGDRIFSGKADESAFCIILKATFIEELDDDDIDFEIASGNRICGASRLFAGDN